MKFVIQRVTQADVQVGGKVIGKIGKGFVVLIGVGPDDTRETADRYLRKMIGLRIFDDENGKYAPVEGVTLAKAYLSSVSSSWDLYAYTSSNFSWDNLSSTVSNTTTSNTTVDNTTAKGVLPHAGKTTLAILGIITVAGVSVILYKKYNTYKDI